MFVIEPCKLGSEWCFDDAERGLKAEPFVCGTSEMITKATQGQEYFAIRLDIEPFPGHQFTLYWCQAENGANWYTCPKLGEETGPALYKHFPEAP
jgi:hypothetical protein